MIVWVWVNLKKYNNSNDFIFNHFYAMNNIFWVQVILFGSNFVQITIGSDHLDHTIFYRTSKMTSLITIVFAYCTGRPYLSQTHKLTLNCQISDKNLVFISIRALLSIFLVTDHWLTEVLHLLFLLRWNCLLPNHESNPFCFLQGLLQNLN